MSEPLFRYVGCEDGCDCASASYGACDGCGRQTYEQIPEGSRVLSAAQVEQLRDALGSIIAQCEHRRIGVYADGSTQWSMPMAGTIYRLAVPALALLDGEQP